MDDQGGCEQCFGDGDVVTDEGNVERCNWCWGTGVEVEDWVVDALIDTDHPEGELS